MPCADEQALRGSLIKMNSMLMPEMSGLMEPALAVLAIIAPLGLAYVLVRLPARRSGKESAAHGQPAQANSSDPAKTSCGKLKP